eukprot:COSAG03_NODE_727_length_6073_cov_3.284901_6_plen_119_part_00
MIYPGRWPRRLLMLLRLIWSTAVVKYYTAVWGYSAFLLVLMLVGFRTPESSSGWNYFHDFPAELIIWAFGPFHCVRHALYSIIGVDFRRGVFLCRSVVAGAGVLRAAQPLPVGDLSPR